jgi:protein-disulfide isomerase
VITARGLAGLGKTPIPSPGSGAKGLVGKSRKKGPIRNARPRGAAGGHDAPGPAAQTSASASSRGLFAKAAPWAGATALVVLAVAVLYFFTGAAATEAFEAPPVTADDISYGPQNPELTVIEYSDFQCPFCAEYAKWLTQLRAKYGDRVQFVFRNYPLAKHEWAQFAAQAAYAASLQGKFWEMHDLLFERQDEWASSSDPRPLFDSYAESLELDLDRFHADADAQSTVDFIKQQATAGKDAGVKHTPWFVIGDESVLPRSLEQFDQAIQEAL